MFFFFFYTSPNDAEGFEDWIQLYNTVLFPLKKHHFCCHLFVRYKQKDINKIYHVFFLNHVFYVYCVQLLSVTIFFIFYSQIAGKIFHCKKKREIQDQLSKSI